MEMRAYDDALTCQDAALRLRPDDPTALDHRSRTLRELGRYQEAVASAEASLRAEPDNTGGLNSPANALRMLGRLDAAETAYARAIETGATGPLRFNLALCQLLRGDFAAGWKGYEHRWSLDSMARSKPPFQQPLWLGDGDLTGRTILLHAEQGVGDTIQFSRLAPLVMARGGCVILGAQPVLLALFDDFPGVDRVMDRSEAVSLFDWHCPLMSLPLALRLAPEAIPAAEPYLRRRRPGCPSGAIAWAPRAGHGSGSPGRAIPIIATIITGHWRWRSCGRCWRWTPISCACSAICGRPI